MGNEGTSASQLLKQANKLKREGRLDEAIALFLLLVILVYWVVGWWQSWWSGG